eukprot:scaffold316257_cov32-Tisochrysis_lutea.AAC.4
MHGAIMSGTGQQRAHLPGCTAEICTHTYSRCPLSCAWAAQSRPEREGAQHKELCARHSAMRERGVCGQKTGERSREGGSAATQQKGERERGRGRV